MEILFPNFILNKVYTNDFIVKKFLEIGKERCFELYKFDKSKTDPRLEEGIKFLERSNFYI